MWRWILTADYFSHLAATRPANEPPYNFILGVDTDVVLLQPPARLISMTTRQEWVRGRMEAHQIVHGAVELWSVAGLESFAEWVGGVYESPAVAALRVTEWGFVFPECRPARSQLIPCEEKEGGKEGGGGMWHMSDMDVLRAW